MSAAPRCPRPGHNARSLVAALALTALALTGCSAGAGATNAAPSTATATAGTAGGGGASGAGAGGDSLAVGFVAEPSSLDFTRNDGAPIPQALLVNVYEGLVKLDQDGRVVPLLARSWQVSPDRRTYTFDLQPNVTFSNGAPFTADDVVFSINRVKADWTISLKAAMDVVERAEAVTPTRVRVTLARPSNSWLFAMTSRVGAMFSRTGVADLAATPVGTGPYRLGRWNRGDAIALERNPDYWGARPAYGSVTLRYFKDPTALNNALLTGAIGVISTVQAPESLGQFADASRFQVIQGTSNGEVVLSMNNARGPLRDKRVRQALRHAIDRRALLDTAWAGRGTLIGSMVPTTDPWYEDLTGLAPHDPARARALLAEAGTPNPTLRLRVPNLPYAVASAQVVKSQLADVGVTANLEVLEFAVWLEQVFKQADYDLSIVNHVEPRDLASFANPQYYWRYDNPTVARQLAAADAGDEAQQVAQLRAAARTVAEDAAADWLFLFPNLVVARPDVTGLPRNAVSESFDLTALGRR